MGPSQLYFASFLFFASSGGRFSSLIFPSLSPQLSDPILLSTFFILPNLASLIFVPPLIHRFTTSSPTSKSLQFPLYTCIALVTFSLAFLPSLSHPLPQILLRAISYISTSAISTLSDSLTVTHSKIHSGDYGKHRLWGAIAWALMSPLVGVLVDATNSWTVTIPLAAISAAATAYAGYTLVVDVESGEVIDYESLNSVVEGDDTLDDEGFRHVTSPEVVEEAATPYEAFKELTRTPPLFLFTFSVFALSIGMAIVESLSFTYFTDVLNAPASLNGATVVVTVLFEIPLFHYSSKVMEKVGYTNLQCIAMLAYSTRVIGYTLVPAAWMVLLLEPLHGVTYALGKTASIEFVKLHADGAVGQGVMNVVRGNVGPIVGLVVAGLIGEWCGQDAVYRTFGVAVSVVLAVYKFTLVKATRRDEVGGGGVQMKVIGNGAEFF